MSLRQTLITSLAFAAVLHIAGCDRRPAPGKAEGPAPAEAQPPASPEPAAHTGSAPAVPAPESGSQPPASTPVPAPAAVLADWGRAIEARDWARVRALWGNRGEDCGLSDEAFARHWRGWRSPRVIIGAGQQEGAAGSSFYTAPVRIEDGAKAVAGQITIRRVNDVPGALPEQLRWHLDAATRAPWTDPDHN